MLRAGSELKHRKNLRQRINGQPEPLHLSMAAQPGSQFVQLQVREPQMAEEALVQGVCVLASACEPPGNRGLSKVEDPRGRRRIQPFSQREIRTMATWWEGVFRRYMGVSRRALNVVRQA